MTPKEKVGLDVGTPERQRKYLHAVRRIYTGMQLAPGELGPLRHIELFGLITEIAMRFPDDESSDFTALCGLAAWHLDQALRTGEIDQEYWREVAHA